MSRPEGEPEDGSDEAAGCAQNRLDKLRQRASPPANPLDGIDSGERLSVGDPTTMRTRLLARMCDTCIFRPGNPMHLHPRRLRDLVTQAVTGQGYIVCHSTLPGMADPPVPPAVCRGFADRYDTQALQIMSRLFGFDEIDPPPGG